jgi:hypothetical protein
MAKDGKKPTPKKRAETPVERKKRETTAERKIREARAVAYWVGRDDWLSGRAPLNAEKPEHRARSQTDLVVRTKRKIFPEGTKGTLRRDVVRQLADALEVECKRRGIKLPSRSTINRALGYWQR